MATRSDEQLMSSIIVSRNLEAFEELLNRYEKPLIIYILRLIGNYYKAQDLCQETFYLIFKNRESFDTRLRFSTWAYRIATNVCVNELKSKTRELEVFLEETKPNKRYFPPPSHQDISDASPEGIIIRNEQEKKIKDLITSLPEKLRSTFVLSEYQGLSHREISAILKIPIGTVKSRLHQSFKQLFALIEKKGLIDEMRS